MQNKLIERPIGELIEYASNPRNIGSDAVDKLAAMIHEFGFRVPIVAKSDGLIVDGHLRLQAAKKLGMETVPCLNADDMTDAQIKAFRIAVNKAAEFASWDDETLAAELEELGNMDFNMELTGFDEDELDTIIAEFDAVDEGLTDDDSVPEAQPDPITVEGDIWLLGKHRLMCGDSTSINAVEKLMDGKKADMLFTDPPYGVRYTGGHNKKKRDGIIADTLEGDNLTGLFYGALTAALTVVKDGAAFYVWYASGKSIDTFASLANLPLEVRAIIQWYKVRSGLGAFMSQYIPNCEPCMYLHIKGKTPAWYGPTTEKTVWELQRVGNNDFHPTQKPVELSERAMNNSSKSGDLILDLFGGSGATLIACEKTARACVMMELDPGYCDVIIKRWQEFTGKEAVHAESGDTYNELV